MSFFFKLFQALLLFAPLFSALSCQNLSYEEKTPSRKKKIGFQKKSAPAIDKSHFEFLSDSSYLKAEMAYFERQNTKALRHLKTALLFNPRSDYLCKRIASIYEREGLFAEALHYYQKIKTGKDREAQMRLTELYWMKGLYKKAFDNQKKLLQKYPNHFSVLYEQALLLSYQAQWSEALKALEKAERRAFNPDKRVQILLPKAYIFAKLKRPSKALSLIKELENLPNPTEEAVLKIADFYEALGWKSSATQYLEKAQKTTEETGLISKALVRRYLAEGNWKKALRQMRNIQNLGRLEEPHYFYMALLYLEQKNYDRALLYFKDLLMKAPNQGQYLYLLAFVYEKKEKWFSALQTYNQVRRSSPHFLAAQLQMAHIWKRIGRQKKSFALLNKLSFPGEGKIQPHPLLLYAESLWDSGYTAQALALLTKGLKAAPFHTDMLFLRGLYFKKSGQRQAAVKDIRRILERKNKHEEALNFLADFYSERKVNLREAESLARKALSLKPNFSPFLSTLGWILFQRGKGKAALHYLNKAYSNDTSALIAKRLGKVYFSLKNFKKSDFFFKEASRLEKYEKRIKQKRSRPIPKQAFIP